MGAPSSTVWGSIVGNYGRIGIYSSLSNTETKTTVTVEVWFWSKYSALDSNNAYYFDNLSTAGAATTSRGSVSINTKGNTGSGWSTSNQQKLSSYSYTYTRGTSAVTRYLRAKLVNIDIVGSAMSAAAAVTIPKLASYTISYNANGGSNAPASQTKWYGKNLTLSSTKPTRTGHSFQGWATSASGSVAYAAGASYTNNSDVTLYAVWKANTYTVEYNANGGSGAPSNQTKTYGKTLTLSSTEPTRTNYNFKGWGTSASATTVAYAAGGSYTANAATTLYAVWELAYVKPRITNVSVTRCDSSGAVTDEGQNGLVSFEWACDKTVSSIVIKWKLSSDSSWTSATVSASGTSGTVRQVIGSDGLSVENTYDIHITVIDSGGSSYTITSLTSMKLSIDFKSGGTGVAFGKAAETDNLAEFAYPAKFTGGIEQVVLHNGTDLDTLFTPNVYTGSNSNSAGYVNLPFTSGTFTLVVEAAGPSGQTKQTVSVCDKTRARAWERYYYSSEWGEWKCIYDFQGIILWSGGYYMTSGHTINLAEKISDQRSGISLVFSEYSDGEPKNTSFVSYFISKRLVSNHGGCGHCFQMCTSNLAYFATKYLYISDAKIVGHDNNGLTGTGATGIQYTNNRFVLRYVIGV